ncbi:MAG: PD-(D/E)XK nuclease family protein [Patescibacteria group bacterium]
MRVSYSALNTYKNCPLQFKYRVLEKIKTPKGIEAVFGTTIHSALKLMFEKNPLFPSLNEVIDFFTNKWSESSKQIANQKQEVLDAFFEEGITLLKNFYKKNPPWNFNILELESRFEVVIEDKKKKEEHVLAGFIDRIDKDPTSDTYEIIDYKTAKRMPSQEMLDNDLQLSIYNLGLIKKWPHLSNHTIKLSLYFLKHNEKIETVRTPEDLENTKKEILKIINEIQGLVDRNEEFIATPSGLCGWCGYQEMCPMWKHLYTKENPRIEEKEAKTAINEYLELKDQNSQNNKRIKALQASICGFMDQEGLERVFGENGYLTRIIQERETFDTTKAKKAFKDMGKLDEFMVKKQVSSLTVSKKKIEPKG